MPLTDYQKRWIVQQSGYDPDKYTADEDTRSIVPIVSKQPSVSETPYQPKADLPQTNQPLDAGTLGATGTALGTAAEGALPSVAGGFGAGATMAGLAGLGLDLTGVGLIPGLALGAVGAYGASRAARSAQKLLEPQEWQKAVQAGQQAHPIAAGVGALADLPLGGFGPNSLGNIGKAAGAIPKLVTGMPLAADEASQLANVGIGAAMSPIQQIVESQVEGQPMPSAGSLLKSTAEGAIFSKPNRLGKAMGFHEAPSKSQEFTKEMLARIEQSEPNPDVTIPEFEDLTKPQKQKAELQATGLVSGSLKGAQERSNKMASYKETSEPTTAQEEQMTGEGGPEPISKNQDFINSLNEKAKKNLESPEELQKQLQQELGINEQSSGTAGEDTTHKQETSQIATEAERTTKANLESEGRTGQITPEWWNLAQRVAGKRGATLALDKDLATAGQTTVPQTRNTLDVILAKINTQKAGADTPTHELAHIFLQDLRNSNRPQDKEFVRKYDALVEQHPDYQEWKTKRNEAGLDSTPEEYQATNQGVESINRALSNETGFQKWKNDFTGYLKTRWGKHATTEDYQRLMNYKLLNDPAYYKILGMRKPEQSNLNIGNQEESLKKQESSNLTSPKHDSVIEALDEGVKTTDDATITPERADELQNALSKQVKWPENSNTKKALDSKEFDNLDPDHWKDLRKIYNAESFPDEQKRETGIVPEPVKKQLVAEVPRTIPPKALEVNKPQPKQISQPREKALNYIPGEKVSPTELGGPKLKPIDESKYRRETPITPEEQKNDLLSSKMAWNEIDNTKDPQATMDQLKTQHDYALEKERSYRAIGDIDGADRMANLRTAQQMRMHYLSEKKGIEIPSVEKYQAESNLNSEPEKNKITEKSILPKDETNKVNELYKRGEITLEQAEKLLVGNEKNQNATNIKLPSLHNRIEEFGKKEEAQVLPYSTPKGFTAQIDKIRKDGGKEGNQFADAYEKYVPKKEQLYGKYIAPILKAEKGLSQGEKNKVENVLIMENRDKKSYKNLLGAKQQELYTVIRDSLNTKQRDQIAANQPVEDNGVKRLPKIDPFYYPNRISPKVAEELTSNPTSLASKGLKKDFLDYQVKNGYSKEQGQEKLDTILKAYDTGEPNLTKFNAVRRAEGIGLPDSWMRNNPDKNLSAYFNRVASDRAYHDTMETNPDVMMATKGVTTDPWGKEFAKKSTAQTLEGNEDVKQVMDRIHGEPFSKDEATLKSIQRVATSLFLGPLTNFHIAASSIANSLQYLRPTEAPSALIHALTNIKEGYEKSLESGGIKKNFTKLSDIWDINNTSLEKWRAAGDMIGKVNGRDLTNNFTKAYLQNVGEWIVKSKNIAANSGDKARIDLMKRIDPDWKSGTKYSDKDIENLGSNFGSIIHGGHDARTLPGWMLRDSAIQPFLSLASWNISQTNAWMRHVFTPAKQGNFKPLIMSTLGAAIGGYIIKEGRELLSDKKSPIPSLTEIMAGENDTTKPGLIAYNLMAMSSYTGLAGIYSVIGKSFADLAHKNIPQSATFPLDEVLGNSTGQIAQAISAYMNDSNFDFYNAGTKLVTNLVKENIQIGRIAISWAANYEGISGLEQEHYNKVLNAKTSSLRRFQMTEGIPYDWQTPNTANMYEGLKTKAFKHTEDIGEAAEALPNLIEAAFNKASGDPEILRSELHKIKQNSYQTMPDPERMPLRFMKYATFLSKTQGEDVASQYMLDYFQHKAINEAKGSMVPSL